MEQKAFEIEIQRIRPHLINEAEQLLKDGEEAEDVVQDTILKLWTMRDRLDEYRSMEGLAVVMVRRLALNQMRTITVRKLWNGKKDNEDKSLTPDAELSLEETLEYIRADEYVECTPKAIRMRKIILDHNERKKANKE